MFKASHSNSQLKEKVPLSCNKLSNVSNIYVSDQCKFNCTLLRMTFPVEIFPWNSSSYDGLWLGNVSDGKRIVNAICLVECWWKLEKGGSQQFSLNSSQQSSLKVNS